MSVGRVVMLTVLCVAFTLVRERFCAAGDLGTDRDAFTPATSVVSPGTVLAEGSYVFIDNSLGRPTNNYPELLLRVGGNDWFEWRFGVNYGVGSQGNIVTSVEVGEGQLLGRSLYESSLLYGFKAAVTEQEGLLPESCFIMEGSTPAYGDVFGTVPVTDRWEVHAEYFDTFTRRTLVDVNRGFFSPGTHYMLTKHLEIGIRVGWGVTTAAAPFFSDAGFGWRW